MAYGLLSMWIKDLLLQSKFVRHSPLDSPFKANLKFIHKILFILMSDKIY